jgi:hypothetical protein
MPWEVLFPLKIQSWRSSHVPSQSTAKITIMVQVVRFQLPDPGKFRRCFEQFEAGDF